MLNAMHTRSPVPSFSSAWHFRSASRVSWPPCRRVASRLIIGAIASGASAADRTSACCNPDTARTEATKWPVQTAIASDLATRRWCSRVLPISAGHHHTPSAANTRATGQPVSVQAPAPASIGTATRGVRIPVGRRSLCSARRGVPRAAADDHLDAPQRSSTPIPIATPALTARSQPPTDPTDTPPIGGHPPQPTRRASKPASTSSSRSCGDGGYAGNARRSALGANNSVDWIRRPVSSTPVTSRTEDTTR